MLLQSCFAAGREYVPSTKLEVVRAFLLLGLFAQIGALFILNLMTFGKITKPSYASIAFVLAGKISIKQNILILTQHHAKLCTLAIVLF